MSVPATTSKKQPPSLGKQHRYPENGRYPVASSTSEKNIMVSLAEPPAQLHNSPHPTASRLHYRGDHSRTKSYADIVKIKYVAPDERFGAKPRESPVEKLDELGYEQSSRAKYDIPHGVSSATLDYVIPRDSFMEKLNQPGHEHSSTGKYGVPLEESLAALDIDDLHQCERNAERTKQSYKLSGSELVPWEENNIRTCEVFPDPGTCSFKSGQQADWASAAKPPTKPSPLTNTKPGLGSVKTEGQLPGESDRLPEDSEAVFKDDLDTKRPTQGNTQVGNGQGIPTSTRGCGTPNRVENSTSSKQTNKERRTDKGRKDENRDRKDGDFNREPGEGGVPGSGSGSQDNRKRYACLWFKQDPYRYHRCHKRFTRFELMIAHIKSHHIGACDDSPHGKVFLGTTDLQHHDPEQCNVERVHGFTTIGRYNQLVSEFNGTSEEEKWQSFFTGLFGVPHHGDPYYKELLEDEWAAHREYVLQDPEGEGVLGTHISDFLIEARARVPSGPESEDIDAVLVDAPQPDANPLYYATESTSDEVPQPQDAYWNPYEPAFLEQAPQYNNRDHAMSSQQSLEPNAAMNMPSMLDPQLHYGGSFESPYPRSMSHSGSFSLVPEQTPAHPPNIPTPYTYNSHDPSLFDSSVLLGMSNTFGQPPPMGYGEMQTQANDYLNAGFYSSSPSFPSLTPLTADSNNEGWTPQEMEEPPDHENSE